MNQTNVAYINLMPRFKSEILHNQFGMQEIQAWYAAYILGWNVTIFIWQVLDQIPDLLAFQPELRLKCWHLNMTSGSNASIWNWNMQEIELIN